MSEKKSVTRYEKHIVQCPHCKKDVLDHMTQCPFCGGELHTRYTSFDAKKIKKARVILTIIFVVVAIIILMSRFN